MIIKKIVLNNIRSYENEEITFNKGSTLLAGDIGSGKTSVLLGIEFGLFGLQPGQRGAALLRNGTDKGGVKLTLEIDGKEVILERTLKKGKTISQNYAAIIIDNKKEELSVTELKAKVLSLLNYPPEFSKKQNILYKFTVYTPQEEMKQIIVEDSSFRLNTLRYVFGVDKYRKIINNVSLLKLKLREERRLLEGATQSLDSDRDLLKEKEKLLNEKKDGQFKFKEELLLKIEERKSKEKEKEKISKLMQGKAELTGKLGQTQGILHSKVETFESNKKVIESLKKEINELKKLDFDSKKLLDKEKEIKEKKKELEKLSNSNISISSEISYIRNNLKKFDDLERKMQNLEVCPTCLQTVDAVYRANILNKNYNLRSESKRNLEEKEKEKQSTLGKIKILNESIDLLNKEFTDLKILKMKLEEINEKESKLNEVLKQNNSIKKDSDLLKSQVERIRDELLKLSRYDLKYEEASRELALKLKEERAADIKFAESRKEIEVFENSILELKQRIENLNKIKEKLSYLIELESWLNLQFIPLLSKVEKNVMASLKQEFSLLFSKWFNILVPENFNVHLSDNFTPVIEQKDYVIDYAYLSGGERTAIALAYRLALNQVINSLMSNIKTKDVIILDEPTDGFSSQQLDKMREILDQLKVTQLIIVSHEQKIESFVENIIKFKKDYGLSKKVN